MLIASVESGYARDSSLAQRIDAEQLSNRASVSTNPLLKQSELTEIIDIQVLDADDGGTYEREYQDLGEGLWQDHHKLLLWLITLKTIKTERKTKTKKNQNQNQKQKKKENTMV